MELCKVSFASPSACGDVAASLVDPGKLTNCKNVFYLLRETYALKAQPDWYPRFGYHKAG
jgi:hypothetical protein